MMTTTYLTAVCSYRYYSDTPSSKSKIELFRENIESLKIPTEVLVVELPPYILEDSIRLRPGFPVHLGLNYAIRRAEGEFILCTSKDIIFNDELARFIESKQLRRNTIYRIDRTDVRETSDYGPLERMREYCRENSYKVNTIWDPYKVNTIWNPRNRRATRLLMKMLYWPHPVPYGNASGDFLLMHRTHWFDLRGFPELLGNGLHLDSFVVYSAVYSGLKQVVLKPPMRLYHLDHPRNPPDAGHRPAPHTMKLLRQMRGLRQRMVLNDEDWGTRQEIIEESA